MQILIFGLLLWTKSKYYMTTNKSIYMGQKSEGKNNQHALGEEEVESGATDRAPLWLFWHVFVLSNETLNSTVAVCVYVCHTNALFPSLNLYIYRVLSEQWHDREQWSECAHGRSLITLVILLQVTMCCEKTKKSFCASISQHCLYLSKILLQNRKYREFDSDTKGRFRLSVLLSSDGLDPLKSD